MKRQQKIFYGGQKELTDLLNDGWFLEATLRVIHSTEMGLAGKFVEIVAHLSREEKL